MAAPATASDSQKDEAYRILRHGILFFEHKPGEKLAMKELSERLGLGRTPLRGAFHQLEKEGLVVTVPQSGTYVTKIDMHAAEDDRFVREIVEKEVVRECAALATRADIDRIDRAISLQTRAIREGDREQFFVNDNLMHQTIFEIAGRRAAWDLLNSANYDLERFRLIRVKISSLDLSEVNEQHLGLRDAILHHDTTEASYLASQHLHMMLKEAPSVCAQFPDYFVSWEQLADRESNPVIRFSSH